MKPDKQTNSNRRILQQQADRILNALPVACCKVSREGHVLYINELAATIFSLNPDDVVGRHISEIIPGAGSSLISLFESLDQQHSLAQKFDMPSVSQVNLSLQLLPVEDGIIMLFTENSSIQSSGHSNDGFLSLLQRASGDGAATETVLKKSRDLLQSVFDTSLIGMSVLEAVRDEKDNISDFRIQLVNKELEKETGRTDLTGRLYTAVFPGIRETGILELMLRVIATGKPEQMEYYYSYGDIRKWFCCMYVKRDDGLVATKLDITEQKKAEERIREDAAMIKSIADAVPDMLYLIDTRELRMVYANERVTRLLHKSAAEIREMGPELFDLIVYREDRAKFERAIDALQEAEDGEVQELLFRLVDGNGVLHWVKTRRTVYRRGEDGKPTHVIGVSQDITEQVDLQGSNLRLRKEQLAMVQKQQTEIFKVTLSTKEDERKRIAESLHNDMAQLLYGVKINLDQVQLQRNEPFIAENIVYVKQAQQLLAEAISESRKLSHQLMPRVLEDFGLKAALNNISDQFRGSMDFSSDIKGLNKPLDKYLEIAIFRIVQELATNIVKHSSARKADIRVAIGRKHITIGVQDDGLGFQPWDKTHSGMGLQSIRNKVKLLNGTIDIRSEAGQGTLVTIVLPNKELD